MDAVIRINMDNAAFEGEQGTELARILRELADKVDGTEFSGEHYNLRDINGNTVGQFDVVQD